jgi:hypothetical protein
MCGKNRNAYRVLAGSIERDHLEDLDVDGITLKLIIKK